MPKKNGSVFLLKYLTDNTDSDHSVTYADLQKVLRRNGYSSDIRTIRNDVEILRDAGIEIFIQEQPGFPTSFFFEGQKWETPELHILIDAVASAPFINKERTRILIRKLADLAQKRYRKDLKPRIIVSEDMKMQNNAVMSNLVNIADAIRDRKKISFCIFNYGVNMKRYKRNNNEVYILSPYATVWKEDRYYVIGWSDKRNEIRAFRMDRMIDMMILDDEAVTPPEGFDIRDYANKFTRMYGGRTEKVSLRCRMGLLDQVIDKFGENQVKILQVTRDSFTAEAEVAVGGTFLSWVFQFAGEMTIEGPPSVREMYSRMLAAARYDMQDCTLHETKEIVWKL